MQFKEHISLEINSKKRVRGGISNPVFHIEHQITFSQKPSKSYWVRLENIQIPRSFYMINSSNNVFRVLEDDGVGGDDVITITIDPGNYDIIELLTELETELDANTANANAYTLSYDEIRNTTSISFIGATSADITVTTIASGSTLNQVLGWGVPNTDFITNQDNATVILEGAVNETESPNAINTVPISNVVIETSLTSRNYMTVDDVKHIGAKVPLRVDRNTFEYFENHDGHRSLINSKAPIANLQFFIKDIDDNILDLRGVDWNCNFVIEELTELHKASKIPSIPNPRNNLSANRKPGDQLIRLDPREMDGTFTKGRDSAGRLIGGDSSTFSPTDFKGNPIKGINTGQRFRPNLLLRPSTTRRLLRR